MPGGHDFDGMQYRILRRDGENLGALGVEQLTHGLHTASLAAVGGCSFCLSDYTPARFKDK